MVAAGSAFLIEEDAAKRAFMGHDLRKIVEDVSRPLLDGWQRSGLLMPTDSFGLALANLKYGMEPFDNYYDVSDSPVDLGWFVYYYGPKGLRYAANAVRKNRAAARNHADTLALAINNPRMFEDNVESVEEDGKTFLWGDFARGGAVHVESVKHTILVAVSGFTPSQDHVVANAIGGAIGYVLSRS